MNASTEMSTVQVSIEDVLDIISEKIAVLEKELAISKATCKALTVRNAVLEQTQAAQEVEIADKQPGESKAKQPPKP